jgi:sugar phosphate isomerase/epimerase
VNLAISNLAWNNENNNNIYSLMKNNSFTGLEIAPGKIFNNFPDYSAKEIEIFKEVLLQYKLQLVSMQSILFGTQDLHLFESDESRKSLFRHMKHCIDLAHNLNCKNIVFGAPKNRIIKDYEKDYLKAVEFFYELGKYCEGKNVCIAIEPNPALYGGNFLLTTEETYIFLKAVNHPNITLQLDAGTQIENNEDINALSNYIKFISHVHLSRPGLKFYEYKAWDLELLKRLASLGYDKYISIEMLASNIQETELAISYLKELQNFL